MNRLGTMLKAGLGVSGIELANQIDIPTTTDVAEIIKLGIQLTIGLVTIINLFRKPKYQIDDLDDLKEKNQLRKSDRQERKEKRKLEKFPD